MEYSKLVRGVAHLLFSSSTLIISLSAIANSPVCYNQRAQVNKNNKWGNNMKSQNHTASQSHLSVDSFNKIKDTDQFLSKRVHRYMYKIHTHTHHQHTDLTHCSHPQWLEWKPEWSPHLTCSAQPRCEEVSQQPCTHPLNEDVYHEEPIPSHRTVKIQSSALSLFSRETTQPSNMRSTRGHVLTK